MSDYEIMVTQILTGIHMTTPSLTDTAKLIAVRTFFCNVGSALVAVSIFDKLCSCDDVDADPAVVTGHPLIQEFEQHGAGETWQYVSNLANLIDTTFNAQKS